MATTFVKAGTAWAITVEKSISMVSNRVVCPATGILVLCQMFSVHSSSCHALAPGALSSIVFAHSRSLPIPPCHLLVPEHIPPL